MKGRTAGILFSLQLAVALIQLTNAHGATANKWGDARNTIEFDPARPISGWVVFKSSADLPLLLSFLDTVPYIHGVKVLINLGNPTSITYRGFKVHAQWGQRRQDFAGDLGQWKSSLKEIVIDIDNNLLPGSKNRFSLFLPKTIFKEFGYLRFFITIKDIHLKTQ